MLIIPFIWSIQENKLDIIIKHIFKVNRHSGFLVIVMYLATISRGGSLFYCIRQSYLDQATGFYQRRNVFDLGRSPTDHFELFENEIPVFSYGLQKAVEKYSALDSNILLEKLLWDFFPQTVREKLDRFNRTPCTPPGPLTENDLKEISETIHIFDRRRLYYLYYGGLDQSRIYRMHEKLCRVLLYKSRDEREYSFIEMEKVLRPGEYRNYIYAIFNLHIHFNASFAAFLPEALPFNEVADFFSDSICGINRDNGFWFGEETTDFLHPHLQRYIVMFFDFSPQKRSFADEFIRNFMNSHRKFRWPERKPPVSEKKIQDMFSASYTDLKKMDKRDLTRLFRKKAMKLHPDQGGDHDRFVELSEIYRTLMQTKK